MSRRTKNAGAVVTGAGSGIGRSFATEIARRGGRVVCADLDETRAKETVTIIEQAGGTAIPVACDVADVAQVESLRDTAVEWLDRPPGLVINNAGIGAGGRVVGDAPLADWQHTLGVNLWGVIHGCHVFAPALRGLGHGGIINVASAAGFTAAPRMAAYNVSKAGVVSLSETLAAEPGRLGRRRHRALPHLRQDQHLRRRVDRPRCCRDGPQDRPDRRVLLRPGRPHHARRPRQGPALRRTAGSTRSCCGAPSASCPRPTPASPA
ncbi:SDR family NAD(P)-dependent oxidoreductase [Nocardioides convexus]|uniref:SDR family NAD(P)-dependent oxidoreductase n=1 Tax=Nocardioides convexus TaxID=2712224 RepID=UPI0024184B46|nr:SDR family NAD(P)-dependent oxidoreductase [Nocardioides convexus]